MTARLGPLVVEAADPAAVRRFWESALGAEWSGRLLRIVPERQPKAGKNRVHPDIRVRDLNPLLDLGAVVLDEYLPMRATVADVEGNEFCAFIDPALAAYPPAHLFAVCTDSDRPADLAGWWAPRVGAKIGEGPDGAPRYLHGCRGWPGLIWKFVGVADERVAPNRWRWSVTSGAETFDAFVDPQGNEFIVDVTE